MQINEIASLHRLVDSHVFGTRSEWERHEIGGNCAFVKPIHSPDPEMKARIAQRFDELGFIPMFFREHGREFVALEGVKSSRNYASVEQAFAEQILAKAT